MKRCIHCLEDKPLAEFGVNRARPDGTQAYCRACVADRGRAWRKANPEKVREAKRRWSATRTTEDRRREREAALARNPDVRRDEYRRAVERHGREALQAKWLTWLEANRDAVTAKNRAWRQAHPEAAREHARRYRHGNHDARRRTDARKPRRRCEATADYAAVILADPCSYCGEAGGTVDHIVPLASGGENHWTNYTGACLACNGGKRDRPLLDYLLRRPIHA